MFTPFISRLKLGKYHIHIMPEYRSWILGHGNRKAYLHNVGVTGEVHTERLCGSRGIRLDGAKRAELMETWR